MRCGCAALLSLKANSSTGEAPSQKMAGTPRQCLLFNITIVYGQGNEPSLKGLEQIRAPVQAGA